MKPRLLDLFCGAGGCTKGYQQAGFYVVGVDNRPQPNYCGDEFVQADALQALRAVIAHDQVWYRGSSYQAIHASPPCQAYSAMSACRPGLANDYQALIEPTRELLEQTGLPYVIENVDGAPLASGDDLFGAHGLTLCGRMFGLPLYRHRLFETSFPVAQPHHPPHTVPASKAGHWRPGTIISVSGNCSPIAEARRAMGIDWTNRDELSEAIPPAYTEFIGAQLLEHVRARAAALIGPAAGDGQP